MVALSIKGAYSVYTMYCTPVTLYCRCLERIKVLTPVFISGIKVYINLLNKKSPSCVDAKESRNETCKSLCAEIHEIIRVLQLTSADDDEPDTDDCVIMKRALVSIGSRQRIGVLGIVGSLDIDMKSMQVHVYFAVYVKLKICKRNNTK